MGALEFIKRLFATEKPPTIDPSIVRVTKWEGLGIISNGWQNDPNRAQGSAVTATFSDGHEYRAMHDRRPFRQDLPGAPFFEIEHDYGCKKCREEKHDVFLKDCEL